MRRLIPFIISLLVTPILLFLGLWSMGMGHGNYILAVLLFPFPIITMWLSSGYFTCPEYGDCYPRDSVLIMIAVLQFPIYGALFSLISKKGILATLLVLLHLSFFVAFWVYFRPMGFW